MGRRPLRLDLTTTNHAFLQQFVRTGTKSARAMTRARILLLSAEPQPISVIASRLNVGPATVQQVRTRYRTGGLHAALYDQPRAGQPRKGTPCEEA